MSLDLNQYFTPKIILNDLDAILRSIEINKSETVIADFTVGEGALLEVAEKLFPEADLIANDIDAKLITKLRKSKQSWKLYNSDFEKIVTYKKFRGSLDLILANPPYSSPHSRFHVFSLDGAEFKASYVASYIAKSLKLLKPSGYMIAIIPSSFMHTDTDRKFVDHLSKNYIFEKIRDYPSRAFIGCDASTTLIKIQKAKPYKILQSKLFPQNLFKIVRGWVPMHLTSAYFDGSIPVLHTTDLKKELSIQKQYFTSNRHLSGAHLIIPRVGRPDKSKVLIYSCEKFAISDCLFALQSDINNLTKIKEIIHQDEEFPQIYGGTGAKYISLSHLNVYLGKIIQKEPKLIRETHITNAVI